MQPRPKTILWAVPCPVAVILMMFGSSDASQEDFYGGHLSVLDGSVSIQSAYDPELRPAEMNLLVEEGTRIVTAHDGRAEVQLSGNDILRLWHDTEVDFIDVEGPVETWMKLGSVYVRTNPERGEGCGQKIVTPTSTVCVTGGTTLKIDVEHEERTRVTVLEGNAEVFSENDSVLLRSRQMATVGVARFYGPTRLTADPGESFIRWCVERDELLVRPLNDRDPPIDITAACELDRYGSWVYVPELSVRVWRPRVVVGWSPYRHGRWTWSLRYGSFWVSHEPWGWLPYHYGSWSWCAPWGWVWVPGHVWHGARVSWVVSGDYIGWRPLLYGPEHITVKIPPIHHRYCFVHETEITRPHSRIVYLDRGHFQRHTIVTAKGPTSIIRPPNRVRKGPEKAASKGGYTQRLPKRSPAVGRHAGNHASRSSGGSGVQGRSFGKGLAEKRTETRKHPNPKNAGQRQDAGAKRVRPSQKPARQTGVRSKPANSPGPKLDQVNSVSKSIARQASRHGGNVENRGHATERKSRIAKPRSSYSFSSQRGRR